MLNTESIHFKAFEDYIKLRQTAWENKYKLSDEPIPKAFAKTHLINNLRYLDGTSQRLIRILNKDNHTSLLDKLITCVVYAVYPSIADLVKCANVNGIFGVQEVERLAVHIDSKAFKKPRYDTCITVPWVFKEFDTSRGNLLRAIVEHFIETVPNEMFRNRKLSYIVEHLECEQLVVANGFAYDQIACNMSYIDELNLKIDHVNRVFYNLVPLFKDIFDIKGSFKSSQEEPVMYEFLDWYRSRDYLDERERLIQPCDLTHMLFGYRSFLNYSKIQKYRKVRNHKGDETLKSVSSIIVPRSLINYYES